MKTKVNKILTGTKNYLRYAIIAVVVVLISLLFPDQAGFKYEFNEGQVWNYENLISPFDYPINKSKTQIDLEKQSIRQNFIPFLKNQESKGDVSKIVNRINPYVSNDSIQYIESFVKNLFDQGIMAPEALKFEGRSLRRFRILEGNRAVNYPVSDFSDLSSARIRLSNELQKNYGLDLNLANSIADQIKANIYLDEENTNRFLEEAYADISLNKGRVKNGELIVSKGNLIDNSTYAKINSLKNASLQQSLNPQNTAFVFAGYLLLTLLIVVVLLIYLWTHFPNIFHKISHLTFILLWLVVFSYLVYLIENKSNLSSYLIPFCIVPIIIKNFFNERLALFVHIVIVLIASFLSELGYEFTFLQILAGIVSVLILSETRYWNRFFIAIFYIFLTYVIAYTGLSLIKGVSLVNIEWTAYGWLALNAMLTLLAYPFIPLLERLFGFTSSISLVELSDMNKPLLKDLSMKAPGTLQHSLQVANLSEAAAEKIGANSLLVKVASLYHDIGKTVEPEFFIENQRGENPHEGLTNFESAKKIIDHVTEGAKMASKARLPLIVKDFIVTHHGTTRVEYFYRNQRNEFPDKEFDESLFRYPGPKPRSKEEGIVMLADSIEASSKSLKNPTGRDIDQLVDKIIEGKITHGQLEDCNLSFKELEVCKDTFKTLLRSIYHVRIEYPEEKLPETPTKATPENQELSSQ